MTFPTVTAVTADGALCLGIIVTPLEKSEKKWYNKNMSKSVDLREAAVAYREAGHTLAETAKIFGVSPSTIYAWNKRKKETGNLNNKPLNRSFKKIDPEKLKAYVKEHPDATQQEMADEFGCCNQAISKALKRNQITRKKRQPVTKNRIRKK